jgi:hypothetical protein
MYSVSLKNDLATRCGSAPAAPGACATCALRERFHTSKFDIRYSIFCGSLFIRGNPCNLRNQWIKKPECREMIMKYVLMGISLMLIFFVTAELSADKLYTWTDEKGILHITQHPPPKHARIKDVMTYQPQTEAQIQKSEQDERREEMQDEAVRKKNTSQDTEKASVEAQQQDDEDVYIGREGKMIRRVEESKEMHDRRRDVRREYRIRRR